MISKVGVGCHHHPFCVGTIEPQVSTINHTFYLIQGIVGVRFEGYAADLIVRDKQVSGVDFYTVMFLLRWVWLEKRN